MMAEVVCQTRHLLRFGVAAHEADTGDITILGLDHLIEGMAVEGLTFVAPQIGTMASRTATWAAAERDGQGGLVGYLLEDYRTVDIFKHDDSNGERPLLGAVVKNCSPVSGSQ